MHRDPHDWDAFEPVSGPSALPLEEVVLGLLGRLPGRRTMTLADLGGRHAAGLLRRMPEFGRIVPAAVPEDDSYALCGWDVVLALEPMGGADLAALDRRLTRIHDGLAEGGLLVAVFHAVVPGKARRAMGLRASLASPPPTQGLHELEVQYRLRRAGFQGIRLRRFPRAGAAPVLLALAVRRADN